MLIKLPRWIHKAYANFFGYYWTPCPLCGEYMGGHEFSYSKNGALIVQEGMAKIVCPKCREKADRINIEEWGHEWGRGTELYLGVDFGLLKTDD